MITFRLYRPEDRSALEELHRRQVQCTKTEYAFPDLDDPRYLRVFVAEKDGALLGAVVAHATVEVFFLGDDPELIRATVRERNAIRDELVRVGADEAHAFVPVRLAEKMGRLLARLGFRRSSAAFETWYREL